jgi:hypothetical protein
MAWIFCSLPLHTQESREKNIYPEPKYIYINFEKNHVLSRTFVFCLSLVKKSIQLSVFSISFRFKDLKKNI